MTKTISIAALAFMSAFLLPTHGYANSIDRTLAPAPEEISLAFAEIVNHAVDQCREELAGDVFANFRLETCVDGKVADFIEESDTPQLAAYAAGHGELMLAAAP